MGRLDCLLHSIAFARGRTCNGRVVDCSRTGFSPRWTCLLVLRPDGPLAEPLMHDGGVMFTMTTTGRNGSWSTTTLWDLKSGARGGSALSSAASSAQKGSRPRHIAGHSRRGPHRDQDFDALVDKAQAKAPARSLVSIDDVGRTVASSRLTSPSSSPGDPLCRRGLPHHGLDEVTHSPNVRRLEAAGVGPKWGGFRRNLRQPHAKQIADDIRSAIIARKLANAAQFALHGVCSSDFGGTLPT